jgi:hypothetical protein
MTRFQTRAFRRTAPILGTAFVAAATVLSLSRPACAQRVYVYGPPPPPPPPPYYYYPPPRPRYYYYEPPEQQYEFALGADLEGAIPLNLPTVGDGDDVQGGGGFKIRLGERIRLRPGLHITPEGGFAYDHLFANDDIGNAHSWDMERLMAGARLSFGRFVLPTIYGHVGFGWRGTGDPDVPAATGFAYDIGGALDFRFVPRFDFGIHIEYASVDAQPYVPKWLAIGAHIDLGL